MTHTLYYYIKPKYGRLDNQTQLYVILIGFLHTKYILIWQLLLKFVFAVFTYVMEVKKSHLIKYINDASMFEWTLHIIISNDLYKTHENSSNSPPPFFHHTSYHNDGG